MTEAQKYYDLVISKIPYKTILELYHLEDDELTDFVIKGAVHMIERKLSLQPLDSTGFSFHKRQYSEYELVVRFKTKFEFTEDVKICVVSDDWVTIALITHDINMVSSKVLYLTVDKNFLLSNFF